jgi:hypothetical protein
LARGAADGLAGTVSGFRASNTTQACASDVSITATAAIPASAVDVSGRFECASMRLTRGAGQGAHGYVRRPPCPDKLKSSLSSRSRSSYRRRRQNAVPRGRLLGLDQVRGSGSCPADRQACQFRSNAWPSRSVVFSEPRRIARNAPCRPWLRVSPPPPRRFAARYRPHALCATVSSRPLTDWGEGASPHPERSSLAPEIRLCPAGLLRPLLSLKRGA